MNRFVKSVWIIFSIISLLLISAIVFLTVIIDANTFKPWITQWVKENKQRTLAFEGDINLSFYPKINLNLGPVSLSEYQQDKIFSSVEKIQLSVSLSALLRKQFNSEGITIQGINATFIRFEDGRTNIDDLIASDEKSTAFTFDIDYVEIIDTHVILQDEITDKTMTLSNLTLATKRLQTHLFNNIRLNGNGQLVETNTPESMTFDLNLEATQIQLDDGYVTSEPIHLSFNIAGSSNNMIGEFSLSDLTWTGNQLESNSIHFELTSQNIMQTVSASVKTAFIGLPDEQRWTLPDINAAFSLSNTENSAPPINGQLSGNLIFNLLTETLQMNYKGKLADGSFQANFSLTNFSEKIFNLNFYIDQLDLNDFTSPQTPQHITNKKQPDQFKSDKHIQSNDQLDISFLKNLNMTGLIHIGQLQIGDIQSNDIQLQIQPAHINSSTK